MAMTKRIQLRLPEKQSKRRRQRHRSKSRREKDSNTGTGDNNTPDDAEDKEDPIEPTFEQDDREDGQVSPDEQTVNEDSEDSNYLPLSEDEVSLGDEDFIVPEEPLEQERFKRRLIATARSLKRSSSSFKLIKICSTIGGLMSWQPRNMASSAQPKVTRKLYLNLMTRRWSPCHQRIMRLTNHHVAGIKWQLSPNTNPHYLAEKIEIQELGDTHMTCGMT